MDFRSNNVSYYCEENKERKKERRSWVRFPAVITKLDLFTTNQKKDLNTRLIQIWAKLY